MLRPLGIRRRILISAFAGAALLILPALDVQRRDQAHSAGALRTFPNRASQLPTTILWAWERPEKFDFIDPEKVGVAFLAKTIYLRGDQVITRPRLQPLTVPDRAQLIAVARIESDHSSSEKPQLSFNQVIETVASISELAGSPKVVMVQIDFDATTSQRAFYRELLLQLRRKLPPSVGLSITALASWCKGDNWLEDLPVDEAVPMMFRLGIERKQFLSQLVAGEEFKATPCRRSAGISTDEPLALLPPVERLYIFNPHAWSSDALDKIMETYNR